MSEPTRFASPREKLLVRYFRKLPVQPTHAEAIRWMIGGGVLLLLSAFFGAGSSSGCSGSFLSLVFFFVALVVAGHGVALYLREKYRYQKSLVKTFPQPSDREFDQWLVEGVARIKEHSLSKLDLVAANCEDVDLEPIVGPVVSYQEGVPPEDLVSKIGQDDVARFGVYQVTFLWLAQEHLGIFHCVYDFIRDAVLNDQALDFFYRDIISVSTTERSSAVTMRTGLSFTSVEEFRISVANDRYFLAQVRTGKTKQLTGAERDEPPEGCEKAVRVLRDKLREMKAKSPS